MSPLVVLLTYCWIINYNVHSINCVTIQSPISDTTVNSVTSTQCTAPYTLTSCGFKTQTQNDQSIRGSYIIGQTCYAMNGGGSSANGVYAFARCCDFSEYSVSCSTYQSKLSATNDDAKVNVTCQQTYQYLMGCTAHGEAGNIVDGSFPGHFPLTNKMNPTPGTYTSYGNTCSGWVSLSSNDGIQSYGTCCHAAEYDKVTFECISIISESISGAGSTVSLSCPSTDYFMSSCSGSSPWHECNQWLVTNDSQCVARAGGANTGTKASTICCRIHTLAPTQSTQNPTSNPTNEPTIQPSVNPTTIPTSFPSSSPVTLNPTISPTLYPSSSPTTSNPTISPSYTPTLYPSNIPTKSPTKTPTNEGEIRLSTTTVTATNAEADIGSDGLFAAEWLMYVIAAISVLLLIIILVLCYIICQRKNRKKQWVGNQTNVERVISVSATTPITSIDGTDTYNMNGEDPNIPTDAPLSSAVNDNTTTPMMDYTITNNDNNTLNQGTTEMMSLPPPQNGDIENNNSDHSESNDLYIKKGAITAGNGDIVTPGTMIEVGVDLIDETEHDEEDGGKHANDSGSEDLDKMYEIDNKHTTKGDT